MFIKNLSLEWKRKSSTARIVAVHPGTTPSPLSQPFTARVAPEKLYSPETTASRIAAVIENLQEDDSGHLLNWDGSKLPW